MILLPSSASRPSWPDPESGGAKSWRLCRGGALLSRTARPGVSRSLLWPGGASENLRGSPPSFPVFGSGSRIVSLLLVRPPASSIALSVPRLARSLLGLLCFFVLVLSHVGMFFVSLLSLFPALSGMYLYLFSLFLVEHCEVKDVDSVFSFMGVLWVSSSLHSVILVHFFVFFSY